MRSLTSENISEFNIKEATTFSSVFTFLKFHQTHETRLILGGISDVSCDFSSTAAHLVREFVGQYCE